MESREMYAPSSNFSEFEMVNRNNRGELTNPEMSPAIPADTESSTGVSDTDGPTSRLLDLAPELRNQIYALVLPDKPQRFRFMYGQHAAIPNVIHVNIKMRSETSGLYYGESTFDFTVHHGCIRLLVSWIKTQPVGVRKALLANRNVNVRVIIDASHKDYQKIRLGLGSWGLMFENGGGLWQFSCEKAGKERAPVAEMMDSQRVREGWRVKSQARRLALRDGETPAPYPMTEARFLAGREMVRVFDQVFAALRSG
ncbi:hypothetical protein LTR08_009242 [Meristemomyces frigidus]|nr:hypothetical protein LTR08_009242 [Meristemomyces frigidus]